MRNLGKNFLFVVIIFLVMSALFAAFAKPFEQPETVSLTQLAADIETGKVEKVSVTGSKLTVSYKEEGAEKVSTKEQDAALTQTLLNLGVSKEALESVQIESKEETGVLTWLVPLSAILLPLLFFVFFFFLIFRQARAGLGQAFDFTKAKARLFGAEGCCRIKRGKRRSSGNR